MVNIYILVLSYYGTIYHFGYPSAKSKVQDPMSFYATTGKGLDMTVENDELGEFLAKLDRNDPQTATTAILTAFPTWDKRTFVEKTDEEGESKWNESNTVTMVHTPC